MRKPVVTVLNGLSYANEALVMILPRPYDDTLLSTFTTDDPKRKRKDVLLLRMWALISNLCKSNHRIGNNIRPRTLLYTNP